MTLNFLEIFLLFLLLPNIFLLFLLKKDICNKIGKIFSLLIAYGIAPLLSGVIFYYLIWFFPEKSDNFYIFFVLLFWAILLFYSRKKIKELNALYKDLIATIKGKITVKSFILYTIVFFFTLIFSIQTLFYPISENDSAWYFAQSEALHQSKNAHWHKESGSIILNGNNQYYYNKMVRPGIPSSMAFSFLFGQKENNYFIFNFFFVYYYYLLLGMLLLVVSRLATGLGKNRSLSKFIALLFFVFYWNMTRFYIFNNKEVVIYFLALAGIYLIYDLILTKQRNIKMELLLGVILGLNSFVNFHGILIGIFLLIVLFIFSKLSLWQRTLQASFIFVVHLFFSAFEMFQLCYLMLQGYSSASNYITVIHEKMYQVQNIWDIYLKGKLQLITNIGAYGVYFLLFTLILILKFKEIWASIFGKIILLFMAIYYFVVIDPLNLNKNNFSIVLWTSPKYSILVVLFSIVVISVYFDFLTHALSKYIHKNNFPLAVMSFALAIFLYIFKNGVTDLGLKILLGIIQVVRDVSFYAGKVELLYYVILSFVAFFGVALVVFRFFKIAENQAYRFFFAICLLFMISPFFVVNVGKVPLSETFTFLSDSRENKLQNVIYFGDLFKVYYYAKENLPKGTIIQTDLIETYTYNDYFKMRRLDDLDAKYNISGDCSKGVKLFEAGSYFLCQIKT